MKSVFAKTLYTGKEIKKDRYIIFEGKKIAGVTARSKGKVIGSYKVVTPALIDPHSHIGMVRSGEPASEEEANEHLDSIMTVPDALDSLQMDDASLAEAIEMGVLYSCIVPGSGNIISGRSAVIRHYGRNTSDALIARAGIKAAFGYNPMSTTSWKGTRPSTRMGAAALLRRKLDEIRDKMEKKARARGPKKKEITFSREEEILVLLLQGKERLRVHVHKVDDIALILRLADEYNFKFTIEHAMDVNRTDIFQELKKRNIPVVYGPLDCFAYKVELKHENWRNLAKLIDSGVTFGLMTDHPVIASRMILIQTRWLLRLGWTRQQCLELLCRKNAEILGVDHLLGTIEKGKWASFVCWNGDPFDLSSYPAASYGEGGLVYEAPELSVGKQEAPDNHQ